MTPRSSRGTLALFAVLALAVQAAGQPGSLIRNVALPTGASGFGVSVAVDCEGFVYYTVEGRADLFKLDRDGNLLATLPVRDPQGVPRFMDEMAYDAGRNTLWACEHATNPVEIWRVHPGTGAAVRAFTSETWSLGTFRDGLAYDATDDSLWVSGDISWTIEHHTAAGVLIDVLVPENAQRDPLGLISGLCVGAGDELYLGQNGRQQIVRVRKSTGVFLGAFASPGGGMRDEGLECDAVNFFPRLALWAREFESPGFLSVIELDPAACACSGRANEPPLFLFPTPAPGSTLEGSVRVPMSFTVKAADIVPSQVVTLTATGLPAGSTLTPALPRLGNPVATVFTWTPTNTQIGCLDLAFAAADSGSPPAGAQSRFRVCVSECYLIYGTTRVELPLLGEDVFYVLPPEPQRWIPVSRTRVPPFPIPSDPIYQGLRFTFQVLLYNPDLFPTDPLKSSNGLEAVIGSGTVEYGQPHGVHLFGVNSPTPGQAFQLGFTY